jgi:hypothetical protein
MDWEQKYPLSIVTALSRDISDHTPLFLDTGQNSSGSNYNQFKFEPSWLLRDGFREMVTDIWVNENKGGLSWKDGRQRFESYGSTLGDGPKM